MRPASSATICLPNQSARIMRWGAEQAGLPWRSLLSEAGIRVDVTDELDGVLSGAQELRLQDAYQKATRHVPGLWFRMGLQYRLITYGPLGLAVLAAETFGAGLQLVGSLSALTYSLMQYTLLEGRGDVVALAADDTHVPPGQREFAHERALGSVTRFLHDMHPSLSPIVRIETVLNKSRGRHDCESVLGIPVTFGAPVTQWILRTSAARAPLPMASSLLVETYGRLCARLIDQARVSDEVVGELHALLTRSIHRFPMAEEASRALGLSERTLYRRLAANGLTFGRMTDQVREQRAIHLLDHTRMPVDAIAEALGFSEAASFSRTFKRWKGVSPLRFRSRRRP